MRIFSQSKFYTNEKSIGNYDHSLIFTEAIHKLHKDQSYQIATLVNDKTTFIAKLNRRTDKSVKTLIAPELVFGYEELSKKYYPKLYDEICNDDKMKKLCSGNRSNKNIADILRIHQQYFVDYTHNVIGKKTHGKFIWGAVGSVGKIIYGRRTDCETQTQIGYSNFGGNWRDKIPIFRLI